MQTEALKTVIEACLDQAKDAPVPKRIKLYRGLAEFCGDMQQAAQFIAAARELEEADARCRELALLPGRPADPAAVPSPESFRLARDIIRFTRGDQWAACDMFVGEVAALIERSKQP